MTNLRMFGMVATLSLGSIAKLFGCSEPPAPALVQRCIQEHMDRDPASRIGFNHATVMLPQITAVRDIGPRVECDVTAPVISKTVVETESTTTTSFRVHLTKSEAGYSCAAVEKR